MKSSRTNGKVRRLKVYEKRIVNSSVFLSSNTVAHHPEIRLVGKWLADCGFQAGQYVDVTIKQGKLTINHNSAYVDLKISGNNNSERTLC